MRRNDGRLLDVLYLLGQNCPISETFVIGLDKTKHHIREENTLFIQEPLLQKHINFVRMPCVVNDYGSTCVASKHPELFFSQKMQHVLEECLMPIRF